MKRKQPREISRLLFMSGLNGENIHIDTGKYVCNNELYELSLRGFYEKV